MDNSYRYYGFSDNHRHIKNFYFNIYSMSPIVDHDDEYWEGNPWYTDKELFNFVIDLISYD